MKKIKLSFIVIAIIKVCNNLIIIQKKNYNYINNIFKFYNLFLFIISLFYFLGSTLVIMHSNKEPNSIFGGMAAPSWNSNSKNGEDVQDPKG